MSEENIGRVLDITPMLEYQEGAIVSRTLIKKKSGTITVFAFDKGQALSEHTAPFNALVHIIDGAVKISIGGKENNLQSGQGIIMPAGIPHAVYATEKFKMILTMIKSE